METATGADRVLVVLKALAGYPNGATLDTLAHAVGAPKSSVHRALHRLADAQLARQSSRGHYVLGTEFVRLAYAHHEAREEAHLVTPCLERLAETFGETAHYAEREGAEVIYRGKVNPTGQAVQMTSTIGGRNPVYCTGVGKALLAWSLDPAPAPTELETTYGPFHARTPKTIVDPAALLEELHRTRERGYALDDEESEPGINCVALPVFLAGPAAPTGAISVSALAHRLPLDRLVARMDEIRAIVTGALGDVTPLDSRAAAR
jgi:DNA-binding IclR family transcriptional regulator